MPGTRTQTSQFIDTDDGLQQQSLLATRTKRVKVGLRGSREEEATMNTIEFDHVNGKAVATEKKDTVTLDVDSKTSEPPKPYVASDRAAGKPLAKKSAKPVFLIRLSTVSNCAPTPSAKCAPSS